MLSAVENFGASASLPYAATGHHHHHSHHASYAIAVATAARAAAIIPPPQVSPTSPSPPLPLPHHPHLNALQVQAQQIQLQQHQQQQQLHFNQQQQEYRYFLSSSSIANIQVPISPLSMVNTNKNLLESSTTDRLRERVEFVDGQQGHQDMKPLNCSSSTEQENSSPKSIMSITEFTRPHQPNHNNKHEQRNSAVINYSTNEQSGPMNLVRISSTAALETNRPPSSASSSSSVDIENDRSMSPVSIPTRKIIETSMKLQRLPYDGAPGSAAATPITTHQETQNANAVATAAAVYQYNYNHLYSGPRTVLYGGPVIFSSPHHRTSFLNALSPSTPPQSSPQQQSAHPHSMIPNETGNVFSAEYLKAMQNAAVTAGCFYSPPAQAQAAPFVSISNMHNSSTVGSLSEANTNSSSFMPTSSLPSSTADDLRHNSERELRKNDQQTTEITRLSTGTYLNDKVNGSNAADTDEEKFFKVPNGKEGSLKHRILTRPMNSEKPMSTETCKSSAMRTSNSTSNFIKGSYIELFNGVLRRVEDMRTEDFIQSAERSPIHRLTESTVVKITATSSGTIVIAFSYDKNRSKADIEVSSDHPFFVYGQGWASCNAEMSLKAYGLKCQRLQVGDICISLTQREPQPTSTLTNKNTAYAYSIDVEDSNLKTSPGARATPSNYKLCKENSSTTVSQHLTQDLHQHSKNAANDVMANKVSASVLMNHLNVSMCQYSPAIRNTPTVPLTAHHSYPPPDLIFSRFYQQQQQHQHIISSGMTEHMTETSETTLDEQQDQSVSRKRRWSAPESFSNSDDEETEYNNEQRRRQTPMEGENKYKIYNTTSTPTSKSTSAKSS